MLGCPVLPRLPFWTCDYFHQSLEVSKHSLDLQDLHTVLPSTHRTWICSSLHCLALRFTHRETLWFLTLLRFYCELLQKEASVP